MKNQIERASRGAPDAAHTPGPWVAVIDPACGGCRDITTVDGGLLANTSGVDDDEMDEANARLIAQAPTLLAENEKLRSGHVVLLEALRPFADLMDEAGLSHMEECHFGSGDFVIQAADIRRARAAIEQAERT